MELQTNASKVVELDRKIKALTEQFTAVKLELLNQMIADNVSEIVIKRKKVILCHSQNKDFGAEIAAAELQIKAEKKKLETLGEFTISSVTNFIQVRWHSGEVNRLPFRYTFNSHFQPMKNFLTAAAKLDLTVEDILDILGLTYDDIEEENLTVDEIIEAIEDCGDCDDWVHGGDSCSYYCNA